MDTRHVFVLTDKSGRTLGLRSLGAQRYLLDDLEEGKTLGEASADLTPFVITIAGAPFVVFAGPQERPEHAFTVIETPTDAPGHGTPSPVGNGVWMSFPTPFTPGMWITAIWQDKCERELFRLTSPPLYRDSLAPLFGPSWTGYVPLD
jgi:hypothetical protein